VDLAAEAALEAGLPWALVNAGGDLRLGGNLPAPGIDVAVEDPDSPADEILRLGAGRGSPRELLDHTACLGTGLHHLIDPSTALRPRPACSRPPSGAPTCAEAEVRAKDALLRGHDALERTPGVLVTDDGRVLTNLTTPSEVAA